MKKKKFWSKIEGEEKNEKEKRSGMKKKLEKEWKEEEKRNEEEKRKGLKKKWKEDMIKWKVKQKACKVLTAFSSFFEFRQLLAIYWLELIKWFVLRDERWK